MNISDNWSQVRARVAAAALRAGRRPEDVRVIAVSKTFPASSVRAAYDAGIRTFGENRVQEALEKISELPADIEWHLIGHLQTNKARAAVGRFALIHSVDSLHLAQELDRQAQRAGLTQRILLQVNVADEETKSGFDPSATATAASDIAQLKYLNIEGLMTIGPLAEAPEDVRWVFRELRALRDELRGRFPSLQLPELSMGMTGDFEVAVEEGATLIRVGRAIFGERSTVGAGKDAGRASR